MLTRIGKYEVQSEIGEGGFGRVYLAYDPSVDRRVAIKILSTRPGREMLDQFRAEAKTTGNLRHKNIVTVYDFGDHQGIPFLVMELLEGQNLDEAIRTHRQISLFDKLRLLHQTAEGLHYAHEMGVIHRDVTPANIMLLPSGSIKIMDFGIANLVNWSMTKQTARNSITGKPRYMAPEQLTGAPADVQTDIFSFGVVCYECVSGTHPFHSDGDTRVMFRTANKKADLLNRICPDCPEALAVSINRAMAPDRDARYQSLEDVLLDFQPILLDIRREHVRNLMASLPAIAEPDNRRSFLKQVLELDPSHETARALLEELREEDRKQALRRRVNEYRAKGAERLLAKDYGGAIQYFENALRGDNSCDEARVGLEEARELLERTRSCAKLLSTARRELASGGSIAKALQLVEEALTTDPDNEQASELFRTLTVSTAVAKAQRLRSLKEFDAAENVLNSLNELSNETAARNEIVAIRRDRDCEVREARQRHFESRCAMLNVERAAENWPDALRIVAETQLAFPERERELQELTLEIREEQAAAKRARAIRDAISEANVRLAESAFAEAVRALEATLQLYPRERTLLGLKEEASVRLLETQIEADFQGRLNAVRSYMEQRNWRKAGASLEAVALLQPDRPEIDTLAAQIASAQKLERARRAAPEDYRCPKCAVVPPAQAKFCDQCGTRFAANRM